MVAPSPSSSFSSSARARASSARAASTTNSLSAPRRYSSMMLLQNNKIKSSLLLFSEASSSSSSLDSATQSVQKSSTAKLQVEYEAEEVQEEEENDLESRAITTEQGQNTSTTPFSSPYVTPLAGATRNGSLVACLGPSPTATRTEQQELHNDDHGDNDDSRSVASQDSACSSTSVCDGRDEEEEEDENTLTSSQQEKFQEQEEPSSHKKIAAMFKSVKTQQQKNNDNVVSVLILGNATGRTTQACIQSFGNPPQEQPSTSNPEETDTEQSKRRSRQPARQLCPDDPFEPSGCSTNEGDYDNGDNQKTLVYLFCPDMMHMNKKVGFQCEQVIEGNVNSLVDLERALEISKPDHVVCIWNDQTDKDSLDKKKRKHGKKPTVKMPWNKKPSQSSSVNANTNQALSTAEVLDQIHRRYLKRQMTRQSQSNLSIRQESRRGWSHSTQCAAVDALMTALWEYQHAAGGGGLEQESHSSGAHSRRVPQVWMLALPQGKTRDVEKLGVAPNFGRSPMLPTTLFHPRHNRIHPNASQQEQVTESMHIPRRMQKKYHWKAAREAACLHLCLMEHHPYMKQYVTLIQVQENEEQPSKKPYGNMNVGSPLRDQEEVVTTACTNPRESCPLSNNQDLLYFVSTSVSSAQWMAQQMHSCTTASNDDAHGSQEGSYRGHHGGNLMHLKCIAP